MEISKEKYQSFQSSNETKQWKFNEIRNLLSNILTIISLIFLIPGLVYPMVHVRISAVSHLIVVIEQTRSILSTISYLFQHQAYLAGILIILFSVVIPFLKAILLLLIKKERSFLFSISNNARYNSLVYTIIRDWGKWSMADVFVTSIFISYLSTKVIVDVEIQLLPGFYCFLAYCLISLLAVQVMIPPPSSNTDLE